MMKSYLPAERAASIAKCEVADLALLCQAGRIDCRQINDKWLVAEEEIVDTLSMMNREVLKAELADLRRDSSYHFDLTKTEESGQKLLRSTIVVLLLLFSAMSILALSANLANHGVLAAIFSIFRQ